MSTMTEEEFVAKGRQLFGDDKMQWRFECPSCGHVATPQDWKNAGAPDNSVAFSCVGRWLEGTDDTHTFRKSGGPCLYAGGGLFRINPLTITRDGREIFHSFAFAEVAQ